jgi:hypothetical protein
MESSPRCRVQPGMERVHNPFICPVQNILLDSSSAHITTTCGVDLQVALSARCRLHIPRIVRLILRTPGKSIGVDEALMDAFVRSSWRTMFCINLLETRVICFVASQAPGWSVYSSFFTEGTWELTRNPSLQPHFIGPMLIETIRLARWNQESEDRAGSLRHKSHE